MSVGSISGAAGTQATQIAPSPQAGKTPNTVAKVDNDGDNDNGADDQKSAPVTTSGSVPADAARGQNINTRV